MTLLSLNDRIDRIERAHPELLISAPWATASGRWQVIADGKPKSYDNGLEMASDLEERYPPKPLKTPAQTCFGLAALAVCAGLNL